MLPKKKLEVLVARSIFASENVKTGSGVFWKGCDVEKLQATVAQSTFINKNEKIKCIDIVFKF